MRVLDTLTPERVWLTRSQGAPQDKREVFSLLARLLAPAADETTEDIAQRLAEREAVQSTGIGDGVAIPHCSLVGLDRHLAALVVHTEGVDFQSIDGKPVQLIMGVVGPTAGATNHLKFLARVSRLFRSATTRHRLLEAASPEGVIAVVEQSEGAEP